VNSRRDTASLMLEQQPHILMNHDTDMWLTVTPDGKVFAYGKKVSEIVKDISGNSIAIGTDLMDLLPGKNKIGGNIFKNTLRGVQKNGWYLKGKSGRTIIAKYRPLLPNYERKHM